jgi:cytochrome c biogenesis protein
VTQSLAVRVNDFWFDYKSDQVSIEQFYSDLSILTPLGFEKVHKTIFVNRPLNFNQLTFYQTDWNISSIRLKLNKVIQLPIRNLTTENKSKIWFTTFRLSSNPEDTFSIVFQNIHNNFIIYNSKGEQLQQVQINEPFYLGDKEVILFDLINTTGLQIKFDPGIILVYFGFGLLIISVFSSYISHSQVWGLKTQLDFSIGGSTNREQVFFEQELKTILRKLNK